MSPESRRQWIKDVLRCPGLTATQKTVLIALETYADYHTGGNAYPGIKQLAKDCDLGERIVRYALERARGHDENCAEDCDAHLGLIEQTHKPNGRAGKAAVYRLVAQGVTAASSGTHVPVDNSSTGTYVPVDNPSSGTGERQQRHGDDASSGTSVPPTLQAPSNLQHQPLVSDWGTSPGELLADTHTDRPPSRFCDLHPQGTRKPCGQCGNARTAFNAWQAQKTAQDVAIAAAEDRDRKARRKLIEACHAAGGPCDDFGRLDDLTPCTHPGVPRIEHAS